MSLVLDHGTAYLRVLHNQVQLWERLLPALWRQRGVQPPMHERLCTLGESGPGETSQENT